MGIMEISSFIVQVRLCHGRDSNFENLCILAYGLCQNVASLLFDVYVLVTVFILVTLRLQIL